MSTLVTDETINAGDTFHDFLTSAPEYAGFRDRYDNYVLKGLVPYFQTSTAVGNSCRHIKGRDMVDFSTYNYLSLSGDRRLGQAAAAAAEQFGTSAGASRIVAGNCTVHDELEILLSNLLQCEAALTFVGGHATNVSVISHLMGKEDLIVMDKLSHNSIVEGAKLSGARVLIYRHNNVASLQAILSRHSKKYDRILIVLEGIYSMDGDIVNLPQIVKIKREFGAALMVDEAHSIGTLGATGGGVREHFKLDASVVDIWMGTLSKSFGSCGGYIAGSQKMIDFLRYSCPGFVYSVGLAPPVAATAIAAIRIMYEEPERIEKLRDRSDFFRNLALEADFDIGPSHGTPIIPVMVYSEETAMVATQTLQSNGINVFPIMHPAVKKHQARLRFFINASHTDEQIARAITHLHEVKPYLDRDREAAQEMVSVTC